MHLHEMPEAARQRLINMELPTYDETPCVGGPPLRERRIAIITTAGLHRSSDTPFQHGVGEYRIIPDDTDMADLVLSHVSTNFDRAGFLQDFNVCFPIERLREMGADGEIGSIAAYHYSFMGATPPAAQAGVAKELADLLNSDNVDGVIFSPV